MSNFISIAQAFVQWQELAADIPKDDSAMLAESWNNYTDSLEKDGQLCSLQVHYCPAYDDEMPGEGSRFDALSEDREFILERMGVTMDSVFVPFSQSRSKGEKIPSLNWRVTMKKDGREVITTDYMQGCGHCPAYKNPSTFNSGKRDQWRTDQRIKEECETGREVPKDGGMRRPRIAPPSVVDVLYSLLLDASALDFRDFADWCSDLGYDTDSIKAKQAYDECIATATKLRAAFGQKTVDDLRELFEGM